MQITKFEQPKNFVRHKTKGMSKRQVLRFKRKLKVNRKKNSAR